MPFVAHTNNEGAIAPAQAAPGEAYDCLGCDRKVSLRRSHRRGETFVAAHFWHPSGKPDGCSAESETHVRMKSIAASKAQARWPDATVRWEGVVEDRRADVLVEFDTPDDHLGDGVAIECQHKHEEKDIEGVTVDFRQAGYSVLWLYEEHYDGKDVDLDAGDWRTWWPIQVPDAEEWPGYHGIVHWLRQEKPRQGEISVDFLQYPEALDWLLPIFVRLKLRRSGELSTRFWYSLGSNKKQLRLRISERGSLEIGIEHRKGMDNEFVFGDAYEYTKKYLGRWGLYLKEWWDRWSESGDYHVFRANGHTRRELKGHWIRIETAPIGQGIDLRLQAAPSGNPVISVSSGGRNGETVAMRLSSDQHLKFAVMSDLISIYHDFS